MDEDGRVTTTFQPLLSMQERTEEVAAMLGEWHGRMSYLINIYYIYEHKKKCYSFYFTRVSDFLFEYYMKGWRRKLRWTCCGAHSSLSLSHQ